MENMFNHKGRRVEVIDKNSTGKYGNKCVPVSNIIIREYQRKNMYLELIKQ